MADEAVGSEGFENDADEYEYETMTAAEVLEKLSEAWQNEKLCPELLDHKTELVDCILEQVREMEENISHVKTQDFTVSVHKMELERVKFVLCSYLRTRLQKIEKYVLYVLEQEGSRDPDVPSALSHQELVYAKEFAKGMEEHLHSTVLKNLPSNLQKVDKKKAMTRPNLDGFVFLKAVESVEKIVIDPEFLPLQQDEAVIIDLEPGSQHILRYRAISTLLHSGTVKLI